MSAQSLGAGGSAPIPASTSGASEVREDHRPIIHFDKTIDGQEEPQTLTSYDFPPESIQKEARISVPDIQASRAPTGNDYTSFGDEGTTVTVNAYGSIMQITRSLGYGHSGLFCVDTRDACRPTCPQSRLEQLMQMSKSPQQGIRLKYNGIFEEQTDFTQQKPNMEFIFNRWPRFISQPATHSRNPSPIPPPGTDGDGKHSPISLQYFCHKGTVFQRYIFDREPEAPSLLQKGLLGIQQDFYIRTLDFINDSKFDRADQKDDDYTSLPGTNQRGHVFVHTISHTDAMEIGIGEEEYRREDGPRGVALVISVFVNGKAQVLDPLLGHLFLSLSQETRNEFQRQTRVDITIAYRLQILKGIESWRKSFIPASALDAMGSLFSKSSNDSFQNVQWSSNEHVNFITGRNLEHILSVCSIPVPKHHSLKKREDGPKEEDAAREEGDMETTSLAFTCGDLSGHRIASASSFFAFEFLVEILKTLCKKIKEVDEEISNLVKPFYQIESLRDHDGYEEYMTKTREKSRELGYLSNYMSKLRVRIMTTLEAHLTWSAKAEKKTEFVVAKYWITGKEIGDWQSHRSFPPASLTDVPFEIIKLHSLYEFYKANKDSLKLDFDDRKHMEIWIDIDDRKILSERLQTYIRPWLQRLYEGDKRQQYAFHREQKNGSKKYHLADHVWICRAIRCVEELGLEEHLNVEGGKQYLEYPLPEVSRSKELQKIVLKRFTTRNPQSQHQMLATSRTPSESRFLFHATDTALFYAMDNGFFNREEKSNHKRTNWTNKISVWKETIEAQTEHEETQTLDWEKPLWYALAFAISSSRRRINRMTVDEMLHKTAKILFSMSSSSGLFPGLLNEKQEPIPFEDESQCNKYWHATFEIPYALSKYGEVHLEALADLGSLGDSRGSGREKSQEKDSGQLRQPMLKKMEFVISHSLVDESRLVELSDDWLREVPLSLNFDSETAFKDLEFYQRVRLNHSWDFGYIINSSLKSPSQSSGMKGIVFDIPRKRSTQSQDQLGPNLERELQTNESIRNTLEVTRTTQTAKKRLVWLPMPDKETALACYLAAPRVERHNLSVLFDRHAFYEKYFFDGTSASRNEWTTELHLSYFRRADWDPAKEEVTERNRPMIPDPSFILVGPQKTSGRPSKNNEGTKIVRSVMSFRFVGDFFDRFWTCHFLECDPAKLQSEDEYEEDTNEGLKTLKSRLSYLATESAEEIKGKEKSKEPWQQRKVLELLLFDYIIREIISSTEELLNWVKNVIRSGDTVTDIAGIDIVSILEKPFDVRASRPINPLGDALQAGVETLLGNEGDEYFSVVERWRFFEQLLQAIEEDLRRNSEVITSWSSREKDREPERPRWTRSDEMTYRQVINKLQVINQKEIRDLDRLRVSIRTFRDSLIGKMDTMRSDLEYRGSENTSLFTYVTVVFLPLGFATGVLSMSGTPDHPTLVSMITLALVAMAITLFALANAKTTGKKIVRPVLIIFRSINNLFLDPLVSLLLRPLGILGILLRPIVILGRIFSFLCNALLLLGVKIHFSVLVLFYLFFALPLEPVVGRWGSESIKRTYMSIMKALQSINDKATEGHKSNPLKVARERFKEREDREAKRKEKHRRDVERGDLRP